MGRMRDRQDGFSAGLHHLPRQGPAEGGRWPRAMGMREQLQDMIEGFGSSRLFPKFRKLPIIIERVGSGRLRGVFGARLSAECVSQRRAVSGYTAAMMSSILELAARHKANIEGMLTWAFEFEGQPYFDGFRTLATNGIDKPVLNVFRMFGDDGPGAATGKEQRGFGAG